MIIIFHYLYIVTKHYINSLRKMSINSPIAEGTKYKAGDAEENLVFDPPVYKQRYGEIQLILLNNKWIEDIRKIVDFGCAELKLFSFINRLHRINDILAVDIDECLLRDNLFRVQPLTADYLCKRTEPLNVYVLQGSIGDPDSRLIGVDAVIGIEIIEHLYPDTLEALPYNVFGFITPKLAIFTTPNADFNILFPNFRGMRHFDHKFEWTREQFEMWCNNIVTRFPNYTVSFRGIGQGPSGTEHLGCCSQMAIFIKNEKEDELAMNSESSFGICTYHSKSNVMSFKTDQNSYYNLIDLIEYPYHKDERTVKQKISDELQYKISSLGRIGGRFYNEDRNRVEIPVVDLIFNIYSHFTSVPEACSILTEAGFKIEECLVCDQLLICVIYEPEMENASSTSNTLSDDLDVNQDHYEWHAATSDQESDWGVESDTQKNEQQPFDVYANAQELICDIIDNLETNNGENSGMYNGLDENPSINSESNYHMCDSGYGVSSLNLTSSSHSYLDEACEIAHDHRTTSNLTNGHLLYEEDYKQTKSCVVLQSDIQTPTGVVSTQISSSVNYTSANNASIKTANKHISGTSDVNIEKKPVQKCDPIDVVVEFRVNDEVPNRAQDDHGEVYDVFEEVENGDLANNNRDLEGNNYPNAEENERPNENDNENVVLQNNEDERNDDVENRNQMEEYPIVAEVEQPAGEDLIGFEVQYASREALFDPNSQEDLLEDYDVAADGDQNVDLPEIVFVELVPVDINEEAEPIIPVNDPFPNWLLDLLGAENPGEEEVHDEPHFYCQGDGVGVHPSFAEGDDDEEETSSDRTISSDNSQTTSSDARSNDEAEADPSVSEVDAGSLLEDTIDAQLPLPVIRIINMPQSVDLQPKKVEEKPELSVSDSSASSSGTTDADEFFDTIDDTTPPNGSMPQNHINDPKPKK
ncbi:hypothetical protein RI129_000588 [Pyrocoelia pectoralis]|uniref:Small RNA 2'-O-methyltransferase n=1 Tax=Pyrocoelia pectoralis TaxID=417401 RepID=A0AAN7VTM9_9COLE